MDWFLIIIFLSLGAFVGFMAGLLGIGGGGILVPLLVTIFIYLQVDTAHVLHLALGTSMACIVVTSLSSLLAHHKQKAVDWKLVKKMAPWMILGTFSATFIATQLSTRVLAVFFSLFMAYVSLQMFKNRTPNTHQASPKQVELTLISFLIGMISALVSIGGGSLTVPYLNWRSYSIKVAIATSAALGFPIAIAGSIGYFINGMSANIELPNTLGFVYLPAIIFISVTSFITAPWGAKVAHKLPVKTLKRAFGILLIVLSLKMLMEFY